MSVVNKMLNDLEQRKQANTSTAEYQPSAAKSPKPAKAIFYGLALIAAVSIYFLFGQPDNKSASVMQPSAAQSKSVIADTPANNRVVEQTSVAEVDEVATSSQQPNESTSEQTEQTSRTSEVVMPVSTGLNAITYTAEEPLPATQKTIIESQTDAKPVVQEPASTGKLVVRGDKNADNGLRQSALTALREGDEQTAIALLQQLVHQQPNNIGALKKLAAVQFGAQQPSAAMQTLATAKLQAPDDVSVRIMLARLYVQQQQLESALLELDVTNVPATELVDLLSLRANLLQQAERHEAAHQDYQQLVALTPDDSRWWLGLAVNADKAGRYQAAYQAYLKTAQLGQLQPSVQQFVQQRIAVLKERVDG